MKALVLCLVPPNSASSETQHKIGVGPVISVRRPHGGVMSHYFLNHSCSKNIVKTRITCEIINCFNGNLKFNHVRVTFITGVAPKLSVVNRCGVRQNVRNFFD